MAEISLPKLDGEKAAKIAQSDKWGALSRLASIIAGGVTTLLLAPLVIWNFSTTQQSAVTLSAHTDDITHLQATADKIQIEVGADHDWLTTLKTEVEGPNGVIAQIGLLWRRPAQAENKPPQ